MGGGGGGGGSDAVDYQRQQEEARQARIRQGMTQIDEMFNGKDVITGYTGNATPHATGIGDGTYYGPDGRVYNLANGNGGNLRWTGTAAPGIGPDAARMQYQENGRWTDIPETVYSGRDASAQLSGPVASPNIGGIGNGLYYGPDGKAYDVKNGDASNNYYGNVRWSGPNPGVRSSAGNVVQYGSGKSWANMPDELYTGYNPGAGLSNPTNTHKVGLGNGTYYDESGKAYNVKNGDASNGYWGNVRWTGTAAPGIGPEAARVQYNNNGTWENLPDQLYTGTTTEHQGGYDDAYYQKRATAYNEFAMPQLQDQYKDQQKALTYALARGGNLGSSLASQKSGALDKDYALQQQAVYDTGQDYANKARSDVAANKQNLVQLLQASADPEAVANIAQSQAATMSQMPNFSPLSPVISNVAGSLGTYLANQQTADAVKKAYGDPYSNPINRSSGKVG